ncbi:MAG: malto-oligosyltrehalose trehalohydrolase [Ilumatobacter sp.]|uniref:malto-oligosyltrehalose trehalohydrolase n=1 Tax=Ilumatobacter sp. TaxID=1967498 RepID=UPI003C74758A
MTDSVTERPASRLGATPVDGGTRFEVWAPHAERVTLVLDDGEVAMQPPADHVEPTSASATWSTVASLVGAGDRYRFRIDDGEPLADPASRYQPDGVHGASEVVDTTAFDWTDDDWTGVELADTVLYELHVGTFTRDGTFDGVITQLPRLVELGVTTIELMPVNAFPGRRNWGYDGVFPFATQESYGGPAALARLVDAAHEHGLGVVLDVVYNHFGPEGNVLPRFGPYLTDDYSTPWGGAVNVAGRYGDAVRRYFIENAVGWVTDFHLDGLRLDAVHAILDPTAEPFIAELTAAVHDAADRRSVPALVTIESSANDARIVRDTADHGWGCDAVWDDDVHHALRVALTGERHEYYAGYRGAPDVARAFERRFVYDGQHSPVFGRRHGSDATGIDHRRFIVFSQNHDHVGNTPRGLRMLHDAGPDDPRLRLAAAVTLLSPFTPMLFMGEEYAERAPFPYFIDHGDPDLVEAVRNGRQREFAGVDWSGGVADPADPQTFDDACLDPTLGSEGAHGRMLDLYTLLIDVRARLSVLTDPAAHQTVDCTDRLVTVRRTLDDVTTVAVFNFSGSRRPVPGVGDSTSQADVVVDTSWFSDSSSTRDTASTQPVDAMSARLVSYCSNP